MADSGSKRKTIVGQIDAEVLAFTIGNDPVLDLVLAEADCIGSAAHVTMLSRMALVPPLFSDVERDDVVRVLVSIMLEIRAGKFRIRDADQDVHMAIERRLTRELGAPGKKIHTARSRNDQVAVDLRLYAREQILAAMDECLALADLLVAFGKRHAAVPMVGRTHMQPAMPSSVGLWASAHAESLLDDATLLRGAYALNDRCPLGSAASYGVPLDIDPELTARLLGFSGPYENVLYAGNARGKVETVILSAMSQAMLTLSRLSQDLILFSMPEFGYFSLPREYCTGSSIMPQKSNPDVLELVRAKASRVLACANMTAEIVKALPAGYNRDLQETKEPFLDGMRTTRACLRIMSRLVQGTVVHEEALLAGFTPDVFAADRALELVAEGVSFRNAYDHVKAHLNELENVDARTAVAAKTHRGAPAGVAFAAIGRRSETLRRYVAKTRGGCHTAISGLLGVAYPELTTAEGKQRWK